MKNLILSVLILTGASVFAASKTLVVAVKGMHCASCAADLTKTFSAMPEVAKCDVSLKEKKATLELKDGMTLDKAVIAKTVEGAGFKIGAVTEKK
jgi:copper chaperone CopZ